MPKLTKKNLETLTNSFENETVHNELHKSTPTGSVTSGSKSISDYKSELGVHNPLHTRSRAGSSDGLVTPDLEIVNKKSEDKAVLSKVEAESLRFYEPKPGEEMSLFDYYNHVISEELAYRNKNIKREFKPQLAALTQLSEQLKSAAPDTDIKKLVRTHLNTQDLVASDKNMDSNVLWEDIRTTLNDKLGFQPEIKRPNAYQSIMQIDKPRSRWRALLGQKQSVDTNVAGHLKDPYARERKVEEHKSVDEKINKLIQSQANDASETLDAKNDLSASFKAK